MGQFKLGNRSLNELKGVHSDLANIVKEAINITVQDFSVHDGIRTKDEQKILVFRGTSQTLNSRHISGHAVDLVPYINGKLHWEWSPIYNIANAVRTVAKERDISIRWGGAWDVFLTETEKAPEHLVADYVARRRKEGKRVFIDGPHFELPRDLYP